MAAETGILDILSELGLPAGTLALAYGLVRGAGALEKDASDSALAYLSALLFGGNKSLRASAELGSAIIPIIFDRIFGPKPVSFKFISRSILASSFFWLFLLALKRADWKTAFSDFYSGSPYTAVVIGLIVVWYTLDWLSLCKAKLLIRVVSRRLGSVSALLFFVLDVALSFVLSIICAGLYIGFLVALRELSADEAIFSLRQLVELDPVRDYINAAPRSVTISDVIVPSTLFTSVWTFLLFVATIVTRLLAPIDHIRQFTRWWFKDVDKHPLTAVAKVAATILIVAAFSLKAFHWMFA